MNSVVGIDAGAHSPMVSWSLHACAAAICCSLRLIGWCSYLEASSMRNVVRRDCLRLLALGAVGAAGPRAGFAAEYPTRTVRVICPFPAGGSADLVARVVAQILGEAWGKPVIVENKPGAAGGIGADFVAKSEPDGHTLMTAPGSPYAVNVSLYKKLPYDPRTDFAGISVVTRIPSVLVANKTVPYRSLGELVTFAKENPGKVNYASQGIGSTAHLTMVMMEQMSESSMTHIPYRGSAPAITDLLAGQVDVMWDNLGSTLPHIKSGALSVLAIGSAERSASVPDVPTMIELGYPNFISVAWNAVAAPARTPSDIVNAISGVLASAMKRPDMIQRLTDLGFEPVGSTPQQMVDFMNEEIARWSQVIRAGKIQVE
ncbi:MAG: tripartite tricarboxylate transporter substrate binding protein [Rhizobiales bacterium]|nr:tripartite tricarboxylate transporter substrate binding protein [Hyphomicrobiales bacterium]